MLLIESSDELEGTKEEEKCFRCVRDLYTECVQKMISKFPFTDITISDLRILDPEQRLQISVTSVTRLLKQFNNNSIYDVDAVLMEFHEYKSVPDSQLPITHKSMLEEFWALMGELPLLVGDTNAKWFGHLSGFCKNLLILRHFTADPECLFSIIGKVDTSQ